MRYKFPDSVKNQGEAAIIVTTIRMQSKLHEYYDGETIEIIEEPKGFLGQVKKQLFGK